MANGVHRPWGDASSVIERAGQGRFGSVIFDQMDNSGLSVRAILAGQAPKDSAVTVKGWVRTRRDSKAGISFVHISDGSSFHLLQVVAPNTLPNYTDDVLKL